MPGRVDGRGVQGSLADTFRQALAWPPTSGLPPGKPDKGESPGPAWEHLGNFPQAFTRLALIEADQNDRDYAALQAAVKDGRVQTTTDI